MTRRAIGVGISVPLLLLLSWWLGYPVIAIPAMAFILVLLVAALFVIRPPTSGIRRDVDPVRVTRGETAQVHLWKRNLSPLPSVPLDAKDRIGHLTIELSIPATRPGGRAEAVYRFVTSRRGHLEVGPVELSRRDPWGLFHRVRETGEVKEISVYPRVLAIAAPDVVNRLSRDAGAADVTAGSDRFHTLREYVVGDELRKVHWPSSARTGTLMVKQMVDSPRPKLLLFCDCNGAAYPHPEVFEQAIDATVSLAYAIAATGVPLAVAAGHRQELIEVNRPGDLDALLDAFVSVAVDHEPTTSSALRALAVKTKATAVVAVSGPGQTFPNTATALRSSIGQTVIYRIGSSHSTQLRRRDLHIYDFQTADALADMFPGKKTREGHL